MKLSKWLKIRNAVVGDYVLYIDDFSDLETVEVRENMLSSSEDEEFEDCKFLTLYELTSDEKLIEKPPVPQKPEPWKVCPPTVFKNCSWGYVKKQGFTHFINSFGEVRICASAQNTSWTAKDIWPSWEE